MPLQIFLIKTKEEINSDELLGCLEDTCKDKVHTVTEYFLWNMPQCVKDWFGV